MERIEIRWPRNGVCQERDEMVDELLGARRKIARNADQERCGQRSGVAQRY